jgi:hypothetical protein
LRNEWIEANFTSWVQTAERKNANVPPPELPRKHGAQKQSESRSPMRGRSSPYGTRAKPAAVNYGFIQPLVQLSQLDFIGLQGAEAWPAPDSALINAYVATVSSVLPLNVGFPKQIAETRFGLWGYDRPEIAGGDETYERMAADLNMLRRTVDELRGNAMRDQPSSLPDNNKKTP